MKCSFSVLVAQPQSGAESTKNETIRRRTISKMEMHIKNKKVYQKLNDSEYYDYDKYGNLIVKTKSANYRKYSPKCKIFSPDEIQEYIKNRQTP